MSVRWERSVIIDLETEMGDRNFSFPRSSIGSGLFGVTVDLFNLGFMYELAGASEAEEGSAARIVHVAF